MSLRSDLKKFGSRAWPERRLLLEAFVLSGLMRAAILMLPLRRIVGLMGLVRGQNPVGPGAPAGMVADIGWAVRAAALRTPWESACLVQALTGMVMLRRRDLACVLYLGIAKDASIPQTMAAHAWLCCGAATVTGAGGRERFTVIACFS